MIKARLLCRGVFCLSLGAVSAASAAAMLDPVENEQEPATLLPPTIEEMETAVPAASGLLYTTGNTDKKQTNPTNVDISKPALFLALGLGAEESRCSNQYLMKYNDLVSQFLYANGSSGTIRTYVPGSNSEVQKSQILEAITKLGTAWAGCLKGEFPGYEGEVPPDPLGGR